MYVLTVACNVVVRVGGSNVTAVLADDDTELDWTLAIACGYEEAEQEGKSVSSLLCYNQLTTSQYPSFQTCLYLSLCRISHRRCFHARVAFIDLFDRRRSPSETLTRNSPSWCMFTPLGISTGPSPGERNDEVGLRKKNGSARQLTCHVSSCGR